MPGTGTQESQGACTVYTPTTPTVSEDRLRKGAYQQCSSLGSVQRVVGNLQFLHLASLLIQGSPQLTLLLLKVLQDYLK